MKHTIVKEMPLSTADVKDMLEHLKAKHGELSFRAQKTLDHLSSIPVLPVKKAKEFEAALTKKEISRLRDQYIKKIIDVMPVSDKDIKVVLSGFNVSFTNEDLQLIAGITKEHVTH